MAALQAAQAVGGDAQLVETLQQRLRALSKQSSAVSGPARVHVHAKQLERQAEVKRQRLASLAQETKEKELALTVKLRQAEAEIAKAKGREIAAAAKQAVEDARLRAKEEALRREKERQKEEALGLRFAAWLAGRLNEYLRDGPVGQERRARASRLALAAARKRIGLQDLPVPRFWPPSTRGLRQVTDATRHRLRGKQEVLFASPDFCWVLFGRSQSKQDDPKHAFRKLVERLMPEYFAVFNARYGVDNLIVESFRVLDLAFVVANWRYTQVIGPTMYRMGLSSWPPGDEWQGHMHTATDVRLPVPDAGTSPAPCVAQTETAGVPAGDGKPSEVPAPTAATHEDAIAGVGPASSHGCSLGTKSSEHAVVDWTVGQDGEPVRTEDGMRRFLASRALHVKPSDTHGANNCLIDSLLQGLMFAGIARADLTKLERRDACAATRNHLVHGHGVHPDGYLEHTTMAGPIFEFLRAEQPHIFRHGVETHRIALTVTVVDRFTDRAELAPCEPVLVPPGHGLEPSAESTIHVPCQLYACTHLDGTGYHYEWIAAETVCVKNGKIVCLSRD